MPESSEQVRVVWDLPTRLFHWSLVLLIIASWVSAEFGSFDKAQHMLIGHMLLALILFRLVWGFVGGRYARFNAFLYRPHAYLDYVRSVFGGKPIRYRGHNPLGGLSALAMILALTVQVGSGLFTDDDIFATGPLATFVSSETRSFLTSVHHLCFDLLLCLVVLHLVAVILYEFVKRERLVRPMLTGRKPMPPDDTVADVSAADEESGPPTAGSPWMALIVILVTGAIATAVYNV